MGRLLPLALSASFVFLQLCSSQEIPCNVSRDAGQTIYRVPAFKATYCQYSWTNYTGHVLANHGGKTDDLVATKSNTNLTTYGCLEWMQYTRDCISEGTWRKAVCTTNCSENDGLPQNRQAMITGGLIACIVISVPIVGVLLCSKFGRLTCRKPKWLYDAVKIQIEQPNVVDV